MLEEKTEKEMQELSDELMYELAENFEDEKDILFYYDQGLVTLDTVAEWSGEVTIEKLYNDNVITYSDIEKLYFQGKISQEIMEKVTIENENLTYQELINYIKKGYLSEDQIIDLYMQGKIFDVDLEDIARQGKISVTVYDAAVKNRTMEMLEENSNIKLELTNIPYKKEIKGIEIEEEEGPETEEEYTSPDSYYFPPEDNKKTIIDPFARYQYLELLRAVPAEPFGIDEDNAFYHYEFFVIPDEQGKLQANSVVIAERILKDINHPEKGVATDNATYFFQYKDLMVNSNLTKKEMVQERKKVVAKTNHRIGSWAIQVLYKIAGIQRSSDLSEFKKGDERIRIVLDELHKIYSDDRIDKILDKAKEIDDDLEHLVEVEEIR